MKKIYTLLVVGLLFGMFNQKAFSQDTEAWAAGNISLNYVGLVDDGDSDPCNDSTLYHVELRFYKDYVSTGNDLPDEKTVIALSRNNNLQLDIEVELYHNEIVNQYCLIGNPVATEAGWYRTKEPISLPRYKDWTFIYRGEFRSTENNNIIPGQTFSVSTTLDNRPCSEPFVFDGETYTNPEPNTSVDFERPHPVISFCSGLGKRYNYKIPVKDIDNNRAPIDKYKFLLSYTLNDGFTKVDYEPGFTFINPFPSSSSINLESGTGVFSFTPSSQFTSSVTVKITENRRWNRIVNICTDPNGCGPNDSTETLMSTVIPVSTMTRDYRVIFDNNCNKRLPEFEGVELEFDPIQGQNRYVSVYNSQRNAYEFECGTEVMTFNLSNPMFCQTLDKNDFRIGMGYDSTTTILNVIDDVVYTECSPELEFDQLTIYLYEPIGPGEYNIFFRYGSNDSTTILNRCDFELPVDEPWVRLYINDEFTYEHPITDTIYCDPADVVLDGYKGIRLETAHRKGNVHPPAKVFFTWRKDPFDPTTPTTYVFPGDENYSTNQSTKERFSFFDVWADSLSTTKVTTNVWQVGMGLDYSIYDPFTGDTIEEKICYDTDIFTITRYENPPVEVPDYDLCPEDDWPTVNLDSMVSKYNAVIDDFIWEAYDEFSRTIPDKSSLKSPEKWDIIGSGSASFNLPGAMTDRYNVFATQVPLLVNNRICNEKDTFIVVKENVKANIGNDTIICPGEEFVLRNDYEYLIPDSMSYEWYINDELVEDNQTDTIMITETGEYKLVVNKNTMVGTFCIGSDSITVNIADSLAAPAITCTDVTFKNGRVVQRFQHDAVQGADLYQFRSVAPKPLEDKGSWGARDARDMEGLGLYHHIDGEQMRAQVRGVNNEVPEDAVCRFGPVSNIAEACDVIVRPTNVFTPNGDGVNDFLSFDLIELYPGSKLQVFNRWGKLIYEDDSYYNDWDGEDHPAGTYFYILDVNDETYGIFKGSFTIIRD